MPFTTPGFGGLALNIAGSTLGDLGTFTYNPGIAQRVNTAVDDATDAVTGYITSRRTTSHDQIKSFNSDIADMELQIASYQEPAAVAVHEHGDRHQHAQGDGQHTHERARQLPSFNAK